MKKIHVSMSAGGENGFKIDCKPLKKQAAYNVCLHLIQRARDGYVDAERYSDCYRAMKVGACVALGMRRQEKEENRAIFYEPIIELQGSSKPIDKESLSYAKGWNQVGGKLDDLPAPGRRK